MKDRITQFLAKEGISPAEFADKIGVQRSSVSHVLNGRNYPSASFIQKMLVSYKTLNPRWLLLGEGAMLEAKTMQVKESTLFQFSSGNDVQKIQKENFPIVDAPINVVSNKIFDVQKSEKPTTSVIPNQSADIITNQSMSNLITSISDSKEVEKIVLFFKDKTFSAYTPSK